MALCLPYNLFVPLQSVRFQRFQDQSVRARDRSWFVDIFDANQPFPPCRLASSHEPTAATRDPKWSGPVGEGANLPRYPSAINLKYILQIADADQGAFLRRSKVDVSSSVVIQPFHAIMSSCRFKPGKSTPPDPSGRTEDRPSYRRAFPAGPLRLRTFPSSCLSSGIQPRGGEV